MAHRKLLVGCVAILIFAGSHRGHAQEKADTNSKTAPLTLHEWGTFTVLQNDDGNPIPGVNVNEEKLPKFVYRLGNTLAPSNSEFSPFRSGFAKGLASGYPAASMRMETPVIYIYPQVGQNVVEHVDISVQFRGGWISEWFPKANVDAPGFIPNTKTLGTLTPQSTGSIAWNNLTIGKEKNRPGTDEHVWLAPRRVSAPILSATNGESENYLFYRGVANIESPLRVQRDNQNNRFTISVNESALKKYNAATVAYLWQVEILEDGQVAWKKLPAFTFNFGNSEIIQTSCKFASKDFSKENMGRLRKDMLDALVAEGLYLDEAIAMLETWKLSYFKTPGLRVFFTLPEEWTNDVLPLNVSHPVNSTRVMIGRIELVSDRQRELLNRFGIAKASDTTWFFNAYQNMSSEQRGKINNAAYHESKERLSDFGIKMPDDYSNFLALGRFREALILEKLRTNPSENLRSFVYNYQLRFRDRFETPPGTEISNSGQ